MKVTAKEVAQRAGTSVSAVSRALRPGAPIAEETRQRILRAATELGYQPPSNQLVSRTTSGSISLIVGDLVNPFYPLVIEELSQELLRRGRCLALHVVPCGHGIDEVMQQVLDYRADGVIMTSVTLSAQLTQAFQRRGIPVVMINRTQPDRQVNAVCCDNYAGARLVARRIIDSGRRRIGFVGGLPDTSTHADRARGFKDVLAEGHVELFKEYPCGFRYDLAFQAMAEAFNSPKTAPDAVFCANDIMGLAAIDAAAAAGLRVKDDVSIIGFDDIPMASWQSYRMTTIRQPIRAMVQEAIDLLEGLLAGRVPLGSVRIVPGRLIERASG